MWQGVTGICVSQGSMTELLRIICRNGRVLGGEVNHIGVASLTSARVVMGPGTATSDGVGQGGACICV